MAKKASTGVVRSNPYNDMGREELKQEAQRRNIDLVGMGGKTSNEEIIDALLASDGVSEDEQAAMDADAEPKG